MKVSTQEIMSLSYGDFERMDEALESHSFGFNADGSVVIE